MTFLYADDIARALEVDEDTVYEMARTRQLPFAISTASPRRLFIDAHDLSMWRETMRAVHMPKLRDLRGKKFGRLTPLEWIVDPSRLPARGIMRGIWRVRCDCGAEKRVGSFRLTSGDTKSCGCLKREAPHGADGRFAPKIGNGDLKHGI